MTETALHRPAWFEPDEGGTVLDYTASDLLAARVWAPDDHRLAAEGALLLEVELRAFLTSALRDALVVDVVVATIVERIDSLEPHRLDELVDRSFDWFLWEALSLVAADPCIGEA